MLALLVTIAIAAGGITEDDPQWDCHTMGNRVCGTSQQIADRAAEAVRED